jgi:hypothetical protein
MLVNGTSATTTSASSSSSVNQPLLNSSTASIHSTREYQEFEEQQRRSKSWYLRCKSCFGWACLTFAAVFIVVVVGLRIFLFKPISRGPPSLSNSTAIEPNTKTEFPLMFAGYRHRTESLLGLGAWVYHIPIPTHPKLIIAAVGYYVERAEGKRRLLRFRGKVINDENYHEVAGVLNKEGMSEYMRFVFTTTPPSGRMLELWDDDTKEYRDKYCPEESKSEFKSFSAFFPEDPKKGDDVTFERREGAELYGFHKDQADRAIRIAGKCMASALFSSQLEAQKSQLVNLLQEFLDR